MGNKRFHFKERPHSGKFKSGIYKFVLGPGGLTTPQAFYRGAKLNG